MKMTMAVSIMLSMMAVSGCQSTMSLEKGAQSKEFTIAVLTRSKVKQGGRMPVDISVRRGSFFNRDVELEMQAEGIGVTPNKVLIKASDLPKARFQIVVPRDAVLGEYRVSVNAMSTDGETASLEFTVKVVAPLLRRLRL